MLTRSHSFLLALSLLTGGCAIHAIAQAPSPNVLAQHPIEGSVDVDVQGIDDLEHCSSTSGLRDFCITHTKTALAEGFSAMLPQFFKAGTTKYKATFKYLDLKLDFASATAAGVAPAVRLSLKWQFILDNDKGEHIIQLAETTTGPQPFVDPGQSDQSLKEVLSAALERIGAQLNAQSAAPEATPPKS